MNRLIILCVTVVLLGGVFGLRLLLRQEARLVIANESTAVISDLSVKVWNQDFLLGRLRPGERKDVRLNEYSDSAWRISGRWADGAEFHEQVGYITHGMSFDDRAVFGPVRKLVFTSSSR
jgi:hypothetical protein